ncbi:MAG TPA: secretin N-terminal domain-containing protein [Gemmatimonadales bacterium]
MRHACRRIGGVMLIMFLSLGGCTMSASAQDPPTVVAVGDSVVFRFVDVELRVLLQAMGRYLDRPLLVGSVQPVAVTFETPAPVPRTAVPSLLRGVVEAHGLELTVDSAFYRVGPRAGGATTIERDALTAAVQDLFVIRLRHAHATDVAGTIGAIFRIAGAGGGGRALSTETLSDDLRRTAAATTGVRPLAEAPAGRERGATLSGEVVIVPDELTNSLLVRADSADFRLISRAVEHLDLRPLQVLIQVVIVEARKDRFFSIGADAAVSDVSLGGQATLDGTLTGAGLGNLVLQVMKLGSFDLDLIIRAAVARGDARIVSRPIILASNNREARILVGSQRPFVQVSRSLPTDTPTRDQVVQYKDVGTKLTVLPTINSDGYVALLIRQEINGATAETQFDAPIISTREAETEVLVRDGHTVVLGGLRERQQEVTKGGIPILSELPLVGGLFGFENRRTIETELFLFITPTILTDDETAQAVTDSAAERARAAGAEIRGGRR